MKKLTAVFIIAILAISCASAGIKFGATMTSKSNLTENTTGSVFSVNLSERDFWAGPPAPGSFGFTLASDFTFSVTFGQYQESQPIHADVGMSLLPGAMYSVRDGMTIHLLGGVRYTRVGYHGEMDKAQGWDKLLAIATIGILGSSPVRVLETVFDLGIKFKALGFGFQFAYPFWQKPVTDFKDGFAVSFYTFFNW